MFIIFFGLAFALLGAASAAAIEAAIEAATVQQSSSTVTYTSSSAPSSTSVGDGSTYTINFENQSGRDHDYGFFLAPPKAPSTPTDTVWTNTWITKNVNDSVKMQIKFTNTFYACVGTAPEALSSNVSITMEQSLPVSLGTSAGNGTISSSSGRTGTFQIISGDNFTYDSNFTLGMGAIGSDGITVVPVGVIQMEPNEAYTIQPVIQFYVSQGSYIPGNLLNIGSVSAKAGFCDFVNNPACDTCSFTQNSHGDFSVNYTFSGSPCQQS